MHANALWLEHMPPKETTFSIMGRVVSPRPDSSRLPASAPPTMRSRWCVRRSAPARRRALALAAASASATSACSPSRMRSRCRGMEASTLRAAMPSSSASSSEPASSCALE
jgi:hypothetical protein